MYSIIIMSPRFTYTATLINETKADDSEDVVKITGKSKRDLAEKVNAYYGCKKVSTDILNNLYTKRRNKRHTYDFIQIERELKKNL